MKSMCRSIAATLCELRRQPAMQGVYIGSREGEEGRSGDLFVMTCRSFAAYECVGVHTGELIAWRSSPIQTDFLRLDGTFGLSFHSGAMSYIGHSRSQANVWLLDFEVWDTDGFIKPAKAVIAKRRIAEGQVLWADYRGHLVQPGPPC